MNWDYHLVPALYRIRINHRVEGEDRNCSALLPWKKDPMSAYNATTDLIRSMVPTSYHKITHRYGTYSNIYIYIYICHILHSLPIHISGQISNHHMSDGLTRPAPDRALRKGEPYGMCQLQGLVLLRILFSDSIWSVGKQSLNCYSIV